MDYISVSLCNSCGFRLRVNQTIKKFGHNVLPCPSCNVFSDFNDSIIQVIEGITNDKQIFRGYTR